MSGSSSGNEDWATVARFRAFSGTYSSTTIDGAESIGATLIETGVTTGFADGDVVYIRDSGTVADGEWGQAVEVITDTSVELWDGLTNAKDAADLIYRPAEVFTCQLDLTAVGRVRVVFHHEGTTGADVHVKAMMVTGDSIG